MLTKITTGIIMNLNNEKISNINLKLSYKELMVLTGDYNLIDNYIFFRESTNALQEKQIIKDLLLIKLMIKLNIISIKLFSKVDIGKFSIVNTAKYQEKNKPRFGGIINFKCSRMDN